MSHYKKHSTFEIQPALANYKEELEGVLVDVDDKFPGALDRGKIKDDLNGTVLEFPSQSHDPEISLDFLEVNLGFTQDQIKMLEDEGFLVLVDDEETTLDKIIHDLKEGGDTTMLMYIDENYQDPEFIAIMGKLATEVERAEYDGILTNHQRFMLMKLPSYIDAIKDLNYIDSMLKELNHE